MKMLMTLLTFAFLFSGGPALADTASEVRATIIASNDHVIETGQTLPGDYSKNGALEFWSSGGLLQRVSDGGGAPFDSFNLKPKHIEVVVLVEGQAAVAHFYSEGSMKPAGSPAVSHYLTRVTQAFVKEDGAWKIRSSHWSPVTGGSGTSQSAEIE